MKIHLRWLPPILSTILFVSLVTTVILFFVSAPAQSKSHLPPLSEAGIYLPGRYVFTLSLTVASLFLFILSPVLGYALIQKINHLDDDHFRQYNQSITSALNSRTVCCFGFCRLRWINIICCIFATIASIGLCGLGLVPLFEGDISEFDTSDPAKIQTGTLVHLGFTGLFFISIFIHMVLGTVCSFWIDRMVKLLGGDSSDKVLKYLGITLATIFKCACTAGIIVTILASQVLVTIIVLRRCDIESIQNNTCAASTNAANYMGPLNQYILISLVILYLGSYFHELKGMVVHLQFTTPDDPLPEESFSTLEEEDLEENAMAPNTRMDREQDVEMVENQVNE